MSGSDKKSTKEKAAILGKNLKKAMAYNGLSQTDLAKSLDLPVSTVAAYAQGQRYPSVANMLKLTERLGVTEEQLLTLESSELGPSDEAMILANVYDKLDDHGKRVLLLLANAERERVSRDRQTHW